MHDGNEGVVLMATGARIRAYLTQAAAAGRGVDTMALARRFREPGATDEDRRAIRNRIVEANLLLVVHYIRSRGWAGEVYLDDLVQAGNLGLLRAVELFDPGREIKFSTYALWWIKHHVDRERDALRQPIAIPVYLRPLVARRAAVRRALAGQLGRSPTVVEVDREMGLTSGRGGCVRAAAAVLMLLPVDDLDVADGSPPDDAVGIAERWRAVEAAIADLDDDDATVLRRSYGLGCRVESDDEIARSIGQQKRTVRYWRGRAVRRLKVMLRDPG